MTDARRASNVVSTRLLVLAAGMLFLATTLAHYRGMIASADQYDDAYITYRCAANLAAGQGLAFNAGERTSCASSLLYAALLAALDRVGLRDLERTGLAIGLIAGLWAAALTAAQCRAAGGFVAAAAFALPVALSGWLSGWSVSGMETTLFAALVLTFTALYSEGRMGAASVALALAMLCRPEGALLWVAAALAEWLARGRAVARSRLPLVVGSLTALALLAFQVAYYGEWIPAPVLYKRVAIYYAPGAARLARGLATFLLGAMAPAALLAAAGCVVRLRALARGALPRAAGTTAPPGRGEAFLVVYLALTMLSLVTGPASDRFRYATHALPLIAIVAAGAWARWLAPRLPAGSRVATLAMIALAGLALAERNQLETARAFSRWAAHQHARKEIGRWIERNVPAGTRVISSDLGAIAYHARSHEFMDATGLTSLVPLHAALDADWRRVWTWLDDARPSLLADTRWPTGEIQSQLILERPETFFRSLRPGAAGGRTLALREPPGAPRDLETPDGYRFIVRDVEW
jgi:arabinofuranosyltransferase